MCGVMRVMGLCFCFKDTATTEIYTDVHTRALHDARPSCRSAQIEANRAKFIAEWSAEHGGASPSIQVLTQIDRRAWAMSRPNKPDNLDEQSWEIGRAHVCTPVTNAHLVCRLLLEKKKSLLPYILYFFAIATSTASY